MIAVNCEIEQIFKKEKGKKESSYKVDNLQIRCYKSRRVASREIRLAIMRTLFANCPITLASFFFFNKADILIYTMHFTELISLELLLIRNR